MWHSTLQLSSASKRLEKGHNISFCNQASSKERRQDPAGTGLICVQKSPRKEKQLPAVSVNWLFKTISLDFPGGPVVKNLPANAGTGVWSLVWEDPTCLRATKSTSHNYWALMLQRLKSAHLEPVVCNERSHFSLREAWAPQLERVCM